MEAAAGLGYLLSQQLVAAGETVLDMPPTLASRIRVLTTGKSNKNDPNDARSVAIAAAQRQGREGWKEILANIDRDLGRCELETHRVIADGDLVAHHITLTGTHQGSTMPLFAGVPVTHKPVTWTYIHIWRIADGKIAEHWACRDDVGLLRQVGPWPPK